MNPSHGFTTPTLLHGRLCVAAAALLWSSSGFFSKILTKDTALGLNSPPVNALAMAFYRVLFGGLILLPMLRRPDISFRPLMVGMVACFAAMNVLFISALTLGTAANAILLQYTAPVWMYLASVWLLGERAERRSSIALTIGIAGIAVIIIGGWEREQIPIIGIALGSGVAYAGVLIFLRVLREASPLWLTVGNHLGAAAVLLPWVWNVTQPTWAQFGVLAVFGSVQMGLAYWLVARGLQIVRPYEAATITLLEPMLNPVWAYLVAGETPSPFTLIGGGFILGALVWRYWPS